MALSLSLNSFGQDCDKYLNKQTNAVNTKGIVLKAIGRLVDGIVGTSFSKLSGPAGDQLQMLDAMLYNTCLQLQTAKNEFVRENMDEKTRNIALEMLKLLKQQGSLTPADVKLLAENGVIDPSESGGNDTPAPIIPQPTPSPPPANGDEVAPPVLPTPSGGSFNTVTSTLPCTQFATTAATDPFFRARAFETHRDPQIGNGIAYTVALEKLAKSVEVSINSTIDYFVSSVGEDTESKDFKQNTNTIVEQTLRGVRIVCEEYQENTTTQRWRCFVALEISKDDVLKNVHGALKRDKQLDKALPNYEKFKKTVEEVYEFDEQMGF